MSADNSPLLSQAAGLSRQASDLESSDPIQAAALYRIAATMGLPCAQFKYALCLYNGQGVEKNLAEAEAWFRAASAQGVTAAKNNLGCMLFTRGQYREAAFEFGSAAAQQHPDALNNLGICYLDGRGVNQSIALARSYFIRADELGHLQARSHLEALNGKTAEEPRGIRAGITRVWAVLAR